MLLNDSYAFVHFSALGVNGKRMMEVECVQCNIPLVVGLLGMLLTHNGIIVAVRLGFHFELITS